MSCLSCNSTDVKVIDSRHCIDGRWRRRYRCSTCLERWTTYENTGRSHKRALSTAEAADVILSDKSTLALAAEYGLSHQAISQIRLGHVYTEVHVHLEKQGYRLPSHGKKLCIDCHHWGRYGCSFDFPDAGDDFATDCDLYGPS
jgi:transcriptional regulator NrdR family protein